MRALQRQWFILSALPKAPGKTDVAQLEEELRRLGITIHRRTIQRDLVALSTVFPLTCDGRSKPFGWSVQPSGAGLDLLKEIGVREQGSAHLALLIKAAAGPLARDLPRSTVLFARSRLPEANAILAGAPNELAAWALLGKGADSRKRPRGEEA